MFADAHQLLCDCYNLFVLSTAKQLFLTVLHIRPGKLVMAVPVAT